MKGDLQRESSGVINWSLVNNTSQFFSCADRVPGWGSGPGHCVVSSRLSEVSVQDSRKIAEGFVGSISSYCL